MNPLENKNKLREQFKKENEKKEKQKREILSFNEYGIKVNAELLKKYRKERGVVTY